MKAVISALCDRILQKPELANEIDAEALGRLLSKDLLEPLEEQYLSKQQVIRAYFCLVYSKRIQPCIDIFSFSLFGFDSCGYSWFPVDKSQCFWEATNCHRTRFFCYGDCML